MNDVKTIEMNLFEDFVDEADNTKFSVKATYKSGSTLWAASLDIDGLWDILDKFTKDTEIITLTVNKE